MNDTEKKLCGYPNTDGSYHCTKELGHPEGHGNGEFWWPTRLLAVKMPVNGKCSYCGSPIGYAPQGDFCTNRDCGYVDGNYWPREPKTPEPGVTPHGAPLNASHQRMWDLLRYCRADLLNAALISTDEYDAFAMDHAAVERLETYDTARQERAKAPPRGRGL